MNDEEIWVEIPGFPGYLVSNHGRFWSSRRDRELKLHTNQYGDLSVALQRDGKQNRMMAKRIVAAVFVEGWDEDNGNDTPMLLDGNSTNLHYANIVWRPRWLAATYARQIHRPRPWYNAGPICDRFGNEYRTALEAAKALGALPSDVVMSAYNGTRVPPGGDVFKFI